MTDLTLNCGNIPHLRKVAKMPKLTDTQTIILSAGAQRSENIALPLPKGLHGAAAKMAVTKMIERGWLQEVDANLHRGEPLWRETGDGHGTTLVATDAGLLAIGIDTVATQNASAESKSDASRPPVPRAGTKQALLIALLQAPEGATMEAITAATGWQAHTARGAISGTLSRKLGLVVTSTREPDRGRVYRIVDGLQQSGTCEDGVVIGELAKFDHESVLP